MKTAHILFSHKFIHPNNYSGGIKMIKNKKVLRMFEDYLEENKIKYTTHYSRDPQNHSEPESIELKVDSNFWIRLAAEVKLRNFSSPEMLTVKYDGSYISMPAASFSYVKLLELYHKHKK